MFFSPPPAPAAAPSAGPATAAGHGEVRLDRGRALDRSQIPPQSGDNTATRTDYGQQASPAAPQALALGPCTPGDFGSKTGSALVTFVKASTRECVITLFDVRGQDGYNIFREAQMVTIADAYRANAQCYNGTNATSTLQLVLFLRAGYYVQDNDSTVGSYGPALTAATRGGLDAFFANPRNGDVGSL